MPPLRDENLRKDGWATLDGKVVKAANTRALIPFLNYLAQTYFAGHGEYPSSCRKVFATLDSIERLLYSAGMFLSDEKKRDLKALFLTLGRRWQHLRHLAHGERDNSWQITPKVHYCMHLPEMADLINPIHNQNYSEESLVGVIARIWGKAARGPYAASIQRATLNRYWVGLEIRMTIPS